MPSPSAIKTFHKELHQWYQQHGRHDLPWRNTKDAYAIYVSEIMLQQTQVKTVLERFYHPFLKRFPTLSSLATSDSEEVLQYWQGLGYYSRALNLHKTAQTCNGTLPKTADELIALPGIGRNTAHAICAFAYHQPNAVMEANVKRVLSRIFALKNPKTIELWDKASQLLNTQKPFDYNQSMMDLGSMVCRKRAPNCNQCPAQTICQGQEMPEQYPAPKAKKTTPVRQKHIAVLRNPIGKYYATTRKSRFLNGLYHFIETDHNEKYITFNTQDLPFKQATHLGHIRQQYSHFTLEANVWLFDIEHSNTKHWYSYNQLQDLPFSMAETKIFSLIRPVKPVKSKNKKTIKYYA